tara:strand:- start:1068 stop:2033 length:966 start_codon:yes stop_codon:yes gene_type:complete
MLFNRLNIALTLVYFLITILVAYIYYPDYKIYRYNFILTKELNIEALYDSIVNNNSDTDSEKISFDRFNDIIFYYQKADLDLLDKSNVYRKLKNSLRSNTKFKNTENSNNATISSFRITERGYSLSTEFKVLSDDEILINSIENDLENSINKMIKNYSSDIQLKKIRVSEIISDNQSDYLKYEYDLEKPLLKILKFLDSENIIFSDSNIRKYFINNNQKKQIQKKFQSLDYKTIPNVEILDYFYNLLKFEQQNLKKSLSQYYENEITFINNFHNFFADYLENSIQLELQILKKQNKYIFLSFSFIIFISILLILNLFRQKK